MRSREIARFLLFGLAACLPFFLLAAASSREMLVVCVAQAVLLLSGFTLFTLRRYQRLRQLNDQMRGVREGHYRMQMDQFEEGELSILYSEIYKVTVQLRETAQQLQESQQFLSDSLSDISHQLKTPLTSMMMMVELMQQPQMDPQQRSEFLRVISNQLSRMQWLIQSLLKMARLQAGAVQFSPSPQKVRSLLSKALSQAEAELVRSGVEWIMECPDDFELMLDENWTVEALGNILRNCAEHTGRGGRIVIRCRRTMLADQIEIEDNGEGIDPQDLPHLFERFYRGRNARPDSVGIGLAMSYQIITGQGGMLRVVSQLGQGSCFQLRFPRQIV